ncbi:hypothetical protein [Saccharopolyspora elongata]|uniref:Uncharacterized protein n=1 Tax=Saccharopolyspora elongata TaxID=2530387 RepID=A0A4R4Y7G6_9PSEU|nr:hypothetical protein [Saccharopolyspora elongata]TDD40368.1 hypothetical protein E1288_35605 [Saccharopolyspora elongata]
MAATAVPKGQHLLTHAHATEAERLTALDVEQDASAYRRTMRDLLRQELFDPRLRDDLPLREYMDLTIDRMKAIFREGLVDNDMWMGQSPGSGSRSSTSARRSPRSSVRVVTVGWRVR